MDQQKAEDVRAVVFNHQIVLLLLKCVMFVVCVAYAELGFVNTVDSASGKIVFEHLKCVGWFTGIVTFLALPKIQVTKC